MIKIFKNIFLFVLLAISVSSSAQITSTSPYSQFGLGDIKGPFLPQTRGIGGVSQAIRKPGAYDNINLANPASYSAITLTTFDVGASIDLRRLSKGGVAGDNKFNSSLSHLVFAIPVNKWSALSFGVLPFTDLGYQFKNTSIIDTTTTDFVYAGEGGVSKAYLGYGFKLGENLSLGFNAGYLFGNLKESRAVEFPLDFTAFSSRTQYQQSVGGFTFDIGLQYVANLTENTKLIFGYTGNTGKSITSKSDVVTTRYRFDSSGNELGTADSTYYFSDVDAKVKMPTTHSVGFAFEKTNSWLIGADFNYARWSDYREGNVNPGLNDSYGFAIGGQMTPDVKSISSYWALVDYQLGFKYDKTFININNTDISQYGVTFGLGFPLPSNRSTFYRINMSAEVGKRGTEKNNLIRDNFVNVHLGFTINDKWFQKTYIE